MRHWTQKQWIELGLIVGGAFLMVTLMDQGVLSPDGTPAQPKGAVEYVVTVAASVAMAYGLQALGRALRSAWRTLRKNGKPPAP